MESEELENFRFMKTSRMHLARLTSLQSMHARAWLTSLLSHLTLTFSPLDYGLVSILYMGLPIPKLPLLGICYCGHQFTYYRSCVHVLKCLDKWESTQIHYKTYDGSNA